MQTRCIRVRLRAGMTARAKQWLRGFEDRHVEALAAMRENGLLWEAAFLEKTAEGDHVLLVQCAPDLDRTSALFRDSDLAIDREAKAMLAELAEHSTQPELLVQLDPRSG